MKKKTAAVTLFLLTLPSLALAYGPYGGGPCGDSAWYGGPHWMGHGFFGGGIFMWILTLLLLGAVIFLGVKLYRGQMPGMEKPIDTLKKRLASGELSIEEYNKLKKEL